MTDIKCTGCGIEISRKPSQLQGNIAFCSKACFYQWTRKETTKKMVAECQSIVEKMGGKILEFSGEGARLRVRAVCKEGHEPWTTRANHIIEGSWCRACGQKSRVERRGDHIYTTDEVREMLAQRGYELISSAVGAQHDRIDIRCSYCGRKWNSALQPILKGGGCPYCRSKCNDMENRCRVVLETIHNKPFIRCKPLKNLGSLLEVDCYNDELKLGLEYDGWQHRKVVPYFGGETHFARLQTNDCKKDALCVQAGITLLRVSDLEVRPETIADVIIEKLHSKNIPFNPVDNETLSRLRTPTDTIYKRVYGTKYLQNLREACEKRGGHLIANAWVKTSHKYDIICEVGHPFKMEYNNIVGRRSWCPVCRRIRQSANQRKYTIDDCQEYAESRGGECTSTEYTNLNSKLGWRCAEGHEWSASWTSVGGLKHWCPKCAHKVAWNKGMKMSEEMCKKSSEAKKALYASGYINPLKGKRTGVVPPNKGQLGFKTVTLREVLTRAKLYVKEHHPGGSCVRVRRGGVSGHKFYSVRGLFVCDKGHGDFETLVNSVFRGHWCRECAHIKIGLKSKGHTLSAEAREKIRIKSLGRKHTAESIEKNRLAHLGKSAWNKGKHGYLTPEAAERIRVANTGRKGYWAGKRLSEEHRAKLSAAHKGKVPWNKRRKNATTTVHNQTLDVYT